MEHQLRNDLLVRAAYVGSKGTHLGYNSDVNAPLLGPGATAGNESAPPQPEFPGSRRGYLRRQLHLQLVAGLLEKRFSHGFTVGANYTFAKSIDQVSYLTDLCGVNVINPYNAGAYRGVSDFNVPHRFVLNYLWQLPSPKRTV